MSAAVCVLWALAGGVSLAAGPRSLPEGELPNDARLGPLTTLNGYFPLEVPASREAWEKRAAEVRRQMLVALGLWPMPEKTPLEPVIHGRVERDGYTVDKVYLQSWPGHFVTGNLYRPTGRAGKLPAVLCPHGHWTNGRFQGYDEKEVAKEIAAGAEQFSKGGRHVIQARCAQLARMGCVVFHYDMVGYADSMQLEHRPGVRDAMNTPENWGYFSPQAELRLQHMMGLQAYNTIRALDFLLSLPEVDAERVGVTGASGGGTQTFILCAIDPRPTVAFPAVMVSTAMQGGCTCENCNYLRVGTGNVEFAGLFCPKPLGMTAANDWTLEMETKGLPELKRLYALYGAEDKVDLAAFLQFGHNYNYVSRAVMYGWMNRHLPLGLEPLPAEEDFEPLSIAEMSVWDKDHPRPPSGETYERSLLATINADSEKQIAALAPRDKDSLTRYCEVVGGAWRAMIGRGMPEPGSVEMQITGSDVDEFEEHSVLLRDPATGAEVPALGLLPAGKWNRTVVLWISPRGKQSLYGTDDEVIAPVRQLLKAGNAVFGIDLLYQGEYLKDGKPLEKQPMVGDALVGYDAYTYGYNHPLFAERVHDILTLVSFARNYEDKPERVHVVALEGAGHWAAAAKVLAGDQIDRLAIDTAGFRFDKVSDFADPDFLPGSVKYGDLPGLLALCAGSELWIAGEGSETPELLKGAAEAAGATEKISMQGGEGEGIEDALEWVAR
jgi:dienelactone hydrolase